MDKSNKEDIRMNDSGPYGRYAPLVAGLAGLAIILSTMVWTINISDPTGSIVNKTEFLRERKRIVAKYADTNRDNVITEEEESDLCKKIIKENNAFIYEDTIIDNDGEVIKYKGLIKFLNDYDAKMSGRGN